MDYPKNPSLPEKIEVVQSADPRIYLAVERTSLACERTQLAWIRTVIGLITAGFAIDKGTALLHEARLVAGHAWAKNGHFAGLLLTSIATALMIAVTILYVRRVRQLNSMRKLKETLPAPTTILSVFICVVGGITIYFLNTTW